MKTSLSGTLNKWDTSLSGTLFSVPKPDMNLTKWDTLLFETSPADVFITFQGKSGVFFCRSWDDKTNEPYNEEESANEREREEEKEDINLIKAWRRLTNSHWKKSCICSSLQSKNK